MATNSMVPTIVYMRAITAELVPVSGLIRLP